MRSMTDMTKEYETSYQEAKEYALRSLTCREQTEHQLSEKLRRREYSPEVIRAVIEFLKEYNYINDERFLEQYIASHCHRMNRFQLEQKLYTLGFRQLRLDEYLSTYDYDEERLLSTEFDSYTRKKDLSDPMVRKKVTAHFMKKGFSYSMISGLIHCQDV